MQTAAAIYCNLYLLWFIIALFKFFLYYDRFAFGRVCVLSTFNNIIQSTYTKHFSNCVKGDVVGRKLMCSHFILVAFISEIL